MAAAAEVAYAVPIVFSEKHQPSIDPATKIFIPPAAKGAIDTVALSAKYEEERNKRLNNGGLAQYQQISQSVKDQFSIDPFVEPGFTRDPVDVEHEVVIIGGGYGGQVIAARLIENGFTDLLIIDRAGDFGGTWYFNRYAGAQCDIESYVYMPLLEELDYIPKEKYAYGDELFAHAQHLGKHYGLYKKVLFQTEVSNLRWDDAASIWHVETSFKDNIRARWVVAANGILSSPKFPHIPGMDKFKGKSFHSSRWDYSYTGGYKSGMLNRLVDKRVGVIGTGATGVQIVPGLGAWSKHLYVFQRTPSAVDVRNNHSTDPDWVKTLRPGWQRERQNNFNTIVSGHPADIDLVNDGWTDITRSLAGGFVAGIENETPEQMAARLQLADFTKTEAIRTRVKQIIKDPKTAEGLTAWYPRFCKRPCFHDEYLPTFNRPSVTLVETQGKGVEAITESGLLANGKEYELDCIVYATGFDWATTDWVDRTGMEIHGRNNLTITDKWQTGIKTLHGWTVRDFPNCVFVQVAQSGSPLNVVLNIDNMARHLVYVLQQAKKRGIRTVEASKEGEETWVKECVEVGQPRATFLRSCTPGFYNDEGYVDDKTVMGMPYSGGGAQYQEVLSKWVEDDKLDGLDITYN